MICEQLPKCRHGREATHRCIVELKLTGKTVATLHLCERHKDHLCEKFSPGGMVKVTAFSIVTPKIDLHNPEA